MSILALCTVIFFLGFGINHFYPNRTLSMVVAIVAIVIGVLTLVGSRFLS